MIQEINQRFSSAIISWKSDRGTLGYRSVGGRLLFTAIRAVVSSARKRTALLLTLVLVVIYLTAFQLPAKASVLPRQDSSGYFISFDGVRIYFEVKGSGPAVLLVHGFTSNGDSWKKAPVYDVLVSAGFRVITVDLRGNGKSDKPHQDTAYARDAEAKDLQGLISLLGIRQYSVVGYSRGSIITARLLVLDKRITKAVMGGIGADFTNPEWPRRIMFYKALIGEPVKELEPMVKRIQDSGLDQLALAYQQKEQPSTSKKELSAIVQPVMVICGDQDADNGSAGELVKLIPNAVQESVPGDHGAAVRTEAFSRKVLAFLIK